MKFEELQELVFNAGIVGAGGAGFPTHKKLSKDIKQIVVNAAECEPLMAVDHHILKKHFRALVGTLKDLAEILGADEVIIGIKGKNISLLDKKICKEIEGTNIKIHEIPDVYPAGDEVVLVYETTGKIIPEGSIPISVGVMVINAETVYNIHNAMVRNQVVTQKYVLIGGAVPKDIIVRVPVGMKISELFKACGYTDLEGMAVINGGPMMGKLVDMDSDVVTKTTKGLLVFPETHQVVQRRRMPMSMTLKRASAACCNCHMCTDMCPRYLLGYNLRVDQTLRAASHAEVQNAESFTQSALCCGCGICTVVACQQMLDPQSISVAVKAELARQGFRRSNNAAPTEVRKERAGRLVPSSVLIDRLGIRKYVKEQVFRDSDVFSPERVYIPFSQHVGKPASPTVKVGDKVNVGDVIAVTEKTALGTVMHASINGTVKEITDRFVVIER
ncbi:MAG: 4Fe-4S dicluster domain-containing protein [Clostridiales bacterium]|nr:4Fe-4S dicluster domain-containing protein [Clostridiales bacterium]